MRLTHLKLAGFKSFVDPTTIHLHGQRVGVVGPNGCGKSNVMESVRWVLGESSAKEMRADAMDAVIFNGASNRKAISRASVELVFDNSLGGASGEWSQYAEISVKRVIERQKGSTYYINNTAVRRRDVADLFLGTGLGGRAYAIIGQNTISRIVEAKPEELRIFLEEAAGISKYKDRRRETELRLRDTRENLTRVEDICRELQKQITKLESQAVVTQQYHAMQDDLKLAEGQFWLLKKRDASLAWEKSKSKVEKLVIQLESQTAELRKSESGLESSRQAFYSTGEAINKAQAAYYEANADVANLENQVKQSAEARDRMTLQLQQLKDSIAHSDSANLQSNEKLVELNEALVQVHEKEQAASAELETLKRQLPELEAEYKKASAQLQTSSQALLEANQRIQIDTNNVQHLSQSIQDTATQIQRLEDALNQLTMPDSETLLNSKSALEKAQKAVADIELAIQVLRKNEDALLANIATLREQQLRDQQALGQTEAEIHSLNKIQQSLNAEGKLSDWLAHQGLNNNARLWQKIKVDDNWTMALEAVLGERLNALLADNYNLNERPPSSLAVGFTERAFQAKSSQSHFVSLSSMVKECAPELQPLLDDWLANIYLLPDSEDAIQVSLKLEAGEKLVNQQGDIFSRGGVIFHGESTHLHGVIEREQRLAVLKTVLPDLQNKLSHTAEQLKAAEQTLTQARNQQQDENTKLKTAMQVLHQQQLEISKLEQMQETAIAREKSLNTDIEVAKARYAQQLANVAQKESTLKQIKSDISLLESKKTDDETTSLAAEQAFQHLRDNLSEVEKNHREITFEYKIINNNINDLNNKIKVINEEKEAFLLRKNEAEKTLNVTSMETLKAKLSEAVTTKQKRETALSEARNQLEAQEAELKTLEQVRMQNEQALTPMRDQLEQARLNEQEARLYFEQCQAGLQDNGMDEDILAKGLETDAKASTYANKTSQLQKEIEALGPVNLAAIQELKSEAERKSYLDSQMLDLTEASQTLEDAINKIDKETREKLMTTFNEANQHFGELFSTLFGGGQAKLELLGEEILDTGLQVFAQPPGKKNTTIQLLSGGEKALTALALVFALFRLNPAPFCLMDEVDAPLDDSNTERFCQMVKKMSEKTQFLFVSHNKITMEIAQQLIGVTMQESGVSRIVDVDIDAAMQMHA
ncbi:MAG: chromosome segregation protein SMC [Methylophilaceae bacterium]